MPRKFFFISVIFLVLGLDQISKAVVLIRLPEGSSIPVTFFFHLTRVNNSGAAFGLLKNSGIFLIAMSWVCVLALGAVICLKKTFFWADFAPPLILAGALGNLADRLRYGYVIDFLDFRIWPVFNLADVSITLGLFLAAIEIFRSRPQAS